jgi:hypothetical protein
LKGSQRRTYDRIFQHPLSHNLGWHDVLGLFRQLGEVEEEPNGNFKVTRNGRSLILNAPRTKDVAEAEEVMALRHFLQESETSPSAPPGESMDWLVVIDHHEARLFRSERHGSSPLRILPHEPGRYFRHAPHSKDFAKGEERPDPSSFFGPVAHALLPAGRILVFGRGTGMASEMKQFLDWLEHHQPALSKRVIGSVVVDGSHLTEGELLEQARSFYASAAPSA